MDNEIQFIDAIVTQRLNRLSDTLSGIKREVRGGSFVTFAEASAAAIESARKESMRKLKRSARTRSEDYEVDLRSLKRVLPQIEGLEQMVSLYLPDVGRQDVPVGILYLVDQLIEQLLPERADPLVHLDFEGEYASLDLTEFAIEDAETAHGPHPVAFRVPDLDPANALLAPIFAHEVGHVAADQRLRVALLSRIDQQVLLDLFDQHYDGPAEERESVQEDYRNQLMDWLEELLCDALAALVAGPSLLFALSVFLAAPAELEYDTHPPQRERVRYCLRLLDEMGWAGALDRWTPAVVRWARTLPEGGRDPISGRDRFLLEALSTLFPLVMDLAREHVVDPFEPGKTELAIDRGVELLRKGVPPVGCEANVDQSGWEVVLAGWVTGIQDGGDKPVALVSAVADGPLNSVLIKSIEWAAVTALWRSNEPAGPGVNPRGDGAGGD